MAPRAKQNTCIPKAYIPPNGMKPNDLRKYMHQGHSLGYTKNESSIIKASIMLGKSSKPAPLRVVKGELDRVVENVVLPLFKHSPSLVATSFEWGYVVGKHCSVEDVGEGAGPSSLPSWLERPGCVKIDSRGKGKPGGLVKVARDLCTSCVLPSPKTKILVPNGVALRRSGKAFWQLEFVLHAKVVGRPGQPGGSWELHEGAACQRLRVGVMLHQLLFYLSEGFVSERQYPFDVAWDSQQHVVMHLCESKRGCATPWHLAMGGHAENLLRHVQFVEDRGKHLAHHYAQQPQPRW